MRGQEAGNDVFVVGRFQLQTRLASWDWNTIDKHTALFSVYLQDIYDSRFKPARIMCLSTYVRLAHDDEITPSAGPTPDSLDTVMAGQETNKAVRAKTNEVRHSQTRIQQPSLMLDAAIHGEKPNSNPGIYILIKMPSNILPPPGINFSVGQFNQSCQVGPGGSYPNIASETAAAGRCGADLRLTLRQSGRFQQLVTICDNFVTIYPRGGCAEYSISLFIVLLAGTDSHCPGLRRTEDSGILG